MVPPPLSSLSHLNRNAQEHHIEKQKGRQLRALLMLDLRTLQLDPAPDSLQRFLDTRCCCSC